MFIDNALFMSLFYIVPRGFICLWIIQLVKEYDEELMEEERRQARIEAQQAPSVDLETQPAL